jgi:hypothetical protein
MVLGFNLAILTEPFVAGTCEFMLGVPSEEVMNLLAQFQFLVVSS